jgi:hypothetical protein
MKRRIAFVTFSGAKELVEDDLLAVEPLARLGIEVSAAVWDDPAVDWAAFDALVLRSIWDYWLRAPELMAWLQAMRCRAVWNPPELARWNADKRYLLELEARGADIIPTRLLARGRAVDLPRELDALGWPRAVLKPAVSAGAYRTFALSPPEAGALQSELDSLLETGDVLLQRFQPEISTEGEWSLIFFAGRFSHAVLKRPAEGGFLVQEHLGGTSRAAEPPPELLRQAQAVLELVRGPWLYARVDGLRVDGRLLLMELEMIEPYLFLGTAPGAAGRFAEAIAARLG